MVPASRRIALVLGGAVPAASYLTGQSLVLDGAATLTALTSRCDADGFGAGTGLGRRTNLAAIRSR